MSLSTKKQNSLESLVWDVLAGQQPFFHILSHPSMLSPDLERQAEFWESGKKDLQVFKDFGGLSYIHGNGVDFGCGLGRLTRAMRSLTAHQLGIDISNVMLEKARNANKEFSTMEFLKINDGRWPVANESCGLVISHLVFEHLSSRYLVETSVREMGRVLEKNGRAVFHITTMTLAGALVSFLQKNINRFLDVKKKDKNVAHLKEKLERALSDKEIKFNEKEAELMFSLDCRRAKSFPLRYLKLYMKKAGLNIYRLDRKANGSTMVAATKA